MHHSLFANRAKIRINAFGNSEDIFCSKHWFFLCFRHTQSNPNFRQYSFFSTSGEKPIMPDFTKPFGQHMQQKPADKFFSWQSEQFLLVVVSPVQIGKSDTVFSNMFDPVIGYGNFELHSGWYTFPNIPAQNQD